MADIRKALRKGTVLSFPGFDCELGDEIGRGSNALVYFGTYRDALSSEMVHRVFIKELFPLHLQEKIFRREDNSICVEPEGLETFQIHKYSFETGNKAHLALLETYPDQIGANLNTYPLNGTLYTILGVSGGESLEKVQKGPARSLRLCANRILAILDALDTFHKNGLAHLDIAPDNVILIGHGNRERALLIDYNSSMPIGLSASEEAPVFSVKQGYTAPEIQLGMIGKIGYASDLYSVAAVFYRLLSGSALTNFQMIRPTPPNTMGCDCVKEETDTVKIWVQEILRRGLQTLPEKRYQTIEQMRRDFNELIDRIDGVGITHWSLWESGRRQASRMIRENPSLEFIRDSAKLFPSVVSDGEHFNSIDKYIQNTQNNYLLIAPGGIGKTTAMLRTAFSGEANYSPERSAVMYLSLYGWHKGENNFIINSLLDGMHFHSQTHTYDDARKSLIELLERPLETRKGQVPVLLLLLDGLNELSGDTKPLLDEINHLSLLQGVRIIAASRQEEAILPFGKLNLTELTDEVVDEALSNNGLLLPESPDMQKLLHSPMMLSMFIQSCKMGEKQVRAASSDELLEDFFSALIDKAVVDLPEETERRWQIEVATGFVLPAIAAEIHKKQRALDDRELLPVVEKCFKLLNGQLSRSFFPKWIGRTALIRGNAKNAEEWYGQIVHDILWKQLGLLVRDEGGKYQISHQVIEEYLLSLNQTNHRKVQKYHRSRAAIISLCLVILLVFSNFIYYTYIAPKPYNENYAKNVMSRALAAYVSAGNQYEQLSNLTETAINQAEAFDENLFLYQNSIRIQATNADKALEFLSRMLGSGEMMPWSKKPMDEYSCTSLLTLPLNRKEDYSLYESVLIFVMSDEVANRHYGGQYPLLLQEVLEVDADIAAALYRIAVSPHVAGKFAEHSGVGDSFQKAFGDVTKQNKHLEKIGVDAQQVREQLNILEGDRNKKLFKLYQCGAFDAYYQYHQK